MRKAALFSAVVISGVFLASCGGGGGEATPPPPPPPPPPPATAEGFWVGTTNTNRDVAGVVLDDGTYYFLYTGVGNPDVIGGVIQGTGVSSSGSFSSTDARDFNLEGLGVLAATISASYNARQTLNGTVTYANGDAVTFTSTFDADYDTTPSLAALAGTFTGQVAFSGGVEDANVTVSASGAISGAGASGCTVTGTAAPRSRGNVFNISLTFGGAPCFFANQTLSGIAHFDSAAKALFAAAPNATRTDGILFLGVKP